MSASSEAVVDDRHLRRTALRTIEPQAPGLNPFPPPDYLNDLKAFLVRHPVETDFKIQLQPGVGFGVVKCHANGCNATISLGPNVASVMKGADGGRLSGYGSLERYEEHVKQDTWHLLLRRRSQAKQTPDRRATPTPKEADKKYSAGPHMPDSARQLALPALDRLSLHSPPHTEQTINLERHILAKIKGDQSATLADRTILPDTGLKRKRSFASSDLSSGPAKYHRSSDPVEGDVDDVYNSDSDGVIDLTRPRAPVRPSTSKHTSRLSGWGGTPSTSRTLSSSSASGGASSSLKAANSSPLKVDKEIMFVGESPSRPRPRLSEASLALSKPGNTVSSNDATPSDDDVKANGIESQAKRTRSSGNWPAQPAIMWVDDPQPLPTDFALGLDAHALDRLYQALHSEYWSPSRPFTAVQKLNLKLVRREYNMRLYQERMARGIARRAAEENSHYPSPSEASHTPSTPGSLSLSRLSRAPATPIDSGDDLGDELGDDLGDEQLYLPGRYLDLYDGHSARGAASNHRDRHSSVDDRLEAATKSIWQQVYGDGASSSSVKVKDTKPTWSLDWMHPWKDDIESTDNGGGHLQGWNNSGFGVAGPSEFNWAEFYDKSAESFLGNKDINKAMEFIGLSRQNQALPGMTIPLMPHQIQSVGWMKHMEKESKFLGGMLCDSMGLGKTVSTIGLLVANMPDDTTGKKARTNLIVAPLSLLDQWVDEIESKTEAGLFKVCIYHGMRKIKDVEKLKKYDCVLTTYQTMAAEFLDEEAEHDRAERYFKKHNTYSGFVSSQKKKGTLFKMKWRRVILDEAHIIRNRVTKASRAAWHLNYEYAWALTGTPNSLADLFPLLRLFPASTYSDWKAYKDHVVRLEKRKPNVAARRAQAILKTISMRRTHDTKIDGRPLVQLPKKHTDVVKIELSQPEREIYDVVEKQAQAKFNKFLKAGTVLKNYSNILLMLLRLRQVCDHPRLIFEAVDDINNIFNSASKSVDELEKERNRAKRLLGEEGSKVLFKRMEERALNRIQSEKEGGEVPDAECPVCYDVPTPTEEVIVACGHLFCYECIKNVLAQAQDEDGQVDGKDPNQRLCPSCRQPFIEERVFKASAFEPLGTELQGSEVTNIKQPKSENEAVDVFKGKKGQAGSLDVVDLVLDSEEEDVLPDPNDLLKPKSEAKVESKSLVQLNSEETNNKGKVKCEVKTYQSQSSGGQDELEEDNGPKKSSLCLSRLRGKKEKKQEIKDKLGELLPSAKITEMLKIVNESAREHPGDKFIVYSQFVTMLNIASKFFDKNGMGRNTIMFEGSMDIHERREAVKSFMRDNSKMIMLVSLKCGGVGLNLTRANRVINLDLAWNPATELQAQDRAHRLGQTKDVFVSRFLVQDSVESRIAEMQARKQGLADGALGEGTGKKMKSLTVGELAKLFNVEQE